MNMWLPGICVAIFMVASVTDVNADCNYEGKTYITGASFIASDGCNRCACSENGLVACTLKACVTPVVMCKSGGRAYPSGMNFTAEDGCNTCFCTSKGVAGCTRKACPPGCFYNEQFHNEGDSFQDRCNTCKCGKNHAVACTRMLCLGQEQRERKMEDKPKCFYNHKLYFSGESFKDVFGCNTCTCSENGQLACTEMFCEDMDTNMNSACEMGGKTYKQGDSFVSHGDCQCRCGEGGAVECNLNSCNAPIELYEEIREDESRDNDDNAAQSVSATIMATILLSLFAAFM